MRRLVVFLALALVPPFAAAHAGEQHSWDDTLVRAGNHLLLDDFGAPQPGPLVLVPYAAALSCDAPSYRFLLGNDAAVAFVHDGTTLRMHLESPHVGYAALAVDTQDAVRTLLNMQEHAVALHLLIAHGNDPAAPGDGPVQRAGTLGVPYLLAGANAHSFGHGAMDATVAMIYADPAPAPCPAAPGPVFDVRFDEVPQSLTPGRVVHAVVLFDPDVQALLPHPVASTLVLQINLYLLRADERVEEVRHVVAPTWEATDLAVPGLVGLALWTRWRRT